VSPRTLLCLAAALLVPLARVEAQTPPASASASAWSVPLPPTLPWSGQSRSLALPPDHQWATPAERASFARTPRYDETVAWLRKLVAASKGTLHLSSIGRSAEGRDLWIVVASGSGTFSPAEARKSGKPIVFAHGGIHAGEIDGKDAGMMLLRDMTVLGTRRDLLDLATFVFMPIFNVDGHERFSAFTRYIQRGPIEAGWRTNARNLNLNRDFTKADTLEMQHLLRSLAAWAPDLYVDIHVTNGADYQLDITWGYNRSSHYSPAIGRWLEQVADPVMRRDLEAVGHRPGWLLLHVDSNDPRKGVSGWWAEPRFSNGYGDARHLPTILVENHSLKPFDQRVLGTRVLLESVVRLAAREIKTLRAAVTEDRTARRDQIPMAFTYAPTREVTIPGVRWRQVDSPAMGGSRIEWTGIAENVTLPYLDMTTPTSTVRRPRAYLIPPAWTEVIEKLTHHGIQVERLAKPLTAEVEMYRVRDARLGSTPFEGRVRVTATPVVERRRETFPAGTARVSTDQALGQLAVLLLEPAAVDSFFQWGFFSEVLQQTEYAEAYLMAPLADRMLAENPALRAEFDKALEDPALANSPSARLDWFYRRTPFYDDRLHLYPVAREP
jgi:murein tripeptide amidase MpaA